MERLFSMWHLRNNIFEVQRKQLSEKIGSHQVLLERIGNSLIESINSKEFTLQQVVDDILEFVNYSPKNERNDHFCWLTLHLALGICCQFKTVTPKSLTRHVLLSLLLHSRGVDYGIFLRDVFDIPANDRGCSLPDKSDYILKVSSGFLIDLHDDTVVDSIFAGTDKVIWAHLIENGSCYYLDLPIGYPITYLSRSRMKASPLILAMLNLRAKAVLVLLRHGVCPDGRPIEYLLRTLSTMHLYPAMETSSTNSVMYSKDILLECLEYCYRVIPTLYVRFESYKASDLQRNDVYYVKEHDIQYLPPFWSCPATLKHLSRCKIRRCLLETDNLPTGIHQLDLMESLTDYLELFD